MSQTILFIRHAYELGGAELYSYFLARELKSLGYEVVVSSSVKGLRDKVQSLGFPAYAPVWVGRLPGKLYQLGSLLTLPILIIHYLYICLRHRVAVANVMSRNDLWALSLIQPILRFKLVWTDHGDLKDLLRGGNILTMGLLHFSLGRCRAIICVSEDEKKRVTAVLKWPDLKEKITVVPNGVKVGPYTPPTNSKIIIGSTARIQPQKGLDVLIDALPIVQKLAKEDFKVRLAGAIDDPGIVDQARKFKLEDLVSFEGYQEDVTGFLSSLDIYVFPSRTEVFPFSTLEAMSAGLPVVATTVGGVPEQIRDGVEGFLVPAGDKVKLAEQISRLINDPALRLNMGKRAYQRAAREFNISKITPYLLEVYGL